MLLLQFFYIKKEETVEKARSGRSREHAVSSFPDREKTNKRRLPGIGRETRVKWHPSDREKTNERRAFVQFRASFQGFLFRFRSRYTSACQRY